MPATVVINARIQSSRLPRKVLLPLGRRPILEHIIERCRKAKEVDEIIVASPDDGEQEEIRILSDRMGVKWIEGSKSDLPRRLHQVARSVRNDHILFLTGDLPFISWEGMDELYGRFNGSYDYGNNIDGRSPYLDGTNCECVSKRGIERQEREATYAREHALIWIRQAEWEKKLTVDAPISCEDVAHLWVMIDDWPSYYAAQYIHTRLQGQTSYDALLWVLRRYKDDIERIEQ